MGDGASGSGSGELILRGRQHQGRDLPGVALDPIANRGAERLLNQQLDEEDRRVARTSVPVGERLWVEPPAEGPDRIDRAVQSWKLASVLGFYLDRAVRYGLVDPALQGGIRRFLFELESGYELSMRKAGLVFRLEGDRFYVAASKNVSEAGLAELAHMPTRRDRTSAIGRALLERRSIHIPDAEADPEYAQEVQRIERFRAAAAMDAASSVLFDETASSRQASPFSGLR